MYTYNVIYISSKSKKITSIVKTVFRMSSMSSFRSFAYANTKYNVMLSRRKYVCFSIFYHLYKSRRVPPPFSNINLSFSIYFDDLEFLLPCTIRNRLLLLWPDNSLPISELLCSTILDCQSSVIEMIIFNIF